MITFINHFPEDGMNGRVPTKVTTAVTLQSPSQSLPVLQERFFGAFFRRLLDLWINGTNYRDILNRNADHWPSIQQRNAKSEGCGQNSHQPVDICSNKVT